MFISICQVHYYLIGTPGDGLKIMSYRAAALFQSSGRPHCTSTPSSNMNQCETVGDTPSVSNTSPTSSSLPLLERCAARISIPGAPPPHTDRAPGNIDNIVPLVWPSVIWFKLLF